MNLLSLLAQTNEQTFFLPRQASNLAVDVDWAWNIVLWVTTFFFFVVVGSMTYFVIRYRRRGNTGATSTVTHNTPLEIVWTGIPLVLVMVFFWIGFKGFMNYDNPPSNATVIEVEARKWGFTFKYPNGGSSDQLYVEIGKPVKLDLHSVDVLHALYVPVFRVQRNLVPFRHTTLWFEPTILSPKPNRNDPGGFNVFCTQYCGDGHSNMHTLVHVLEHDAFVERMKEVANPFKKKIDGKNVFVPYAELGEKLYGQMGCQTCHAVKADAPKGTGPSWYHLWKEDTKFSYPPGEKPLLANQSDKEWEDYLKRSMLNPGDEIVDGYQNQMSQFASQLSGSESNMEKQRALTEYIKSLGNQLYKPSVDTSNKEMMDADNPKFKDKDGNPLHPESLAARALATQPANSSQPK